MISSIPIDGTCFRLEINYWRDNDMDAPLEQHYMWGEDILELLKYYESVMHIFPLINSLIIEDDSK